ncbi:MAG: hypothetical protein KGY43_02020 [Halodesulfurarchaeum sp.]|nr:hypothetical protein [Halodesulfurarchaeum sp.]
MESGTHSEIAATRDSKAVTFDSATFEAGSKTARILPLRTLVGVGVFVSTLLAGLFGWRRFRGPGESGKNIGPIATTTVEEQRSEATPAE